MSRSVRLLLLAGSAIVSLTSATIQANAGAFALKEQSTYGQGTSFAGVAAGGALSSMFWNPAIMTQFRGWAVEGDLDGIFPYASHTPQAGSTALALGGAGNSGVAAAVPSVYGSYQINPNIWLGLSFNAPFGLSDTFPNSWAGRGMAAGDSSLKTYNATPSIAVKINEWISLGLGVQFQYAKATLNSGVGAGAIAATIDGNGWGYGWTAGLTLTPWMGTQIGLGYRSAINQKIDGTFAVNTVLPVTTVGGASTSVNLPGTLSLGIRQRLDQRWTVMGTFEWTNWSRIGVSNVLQPSGAPVTLAGTAVTLPFNYRDGWLVSAGAEYQWSEAFALRAGIGYETSPVTDTVRSVLVPDTNRFWLSGGLTYAFTRSLKMDFAYSHLFMQSVSINQIAGGLAYVGASSPHVDIVSVALRYNFAPEPVRTKLPTK